MVCVDEVEAGRPAPHLIHTAMMRTGVTDPARVLVAGDTALDIRAGRAAGVGLVIGVLSGSQTAAELAIEHPDHILAGVAALPDLLAIPAPR